MNLDELRHAALRRADEAEKRFKLAVFGLLGSEAACVLLYLLMSDLREPLHRLILIAAGIVYVPVVIGLIALGAHINRSTARILLALTKEG